MTSSRPDGWTPARSERVHASAEVVFVGQRQAAVDDDPVLEVDLVLRRPGEDDRPLATSLLVPRGRVGGFVAGLRLPVEISLTDPSVLDVDWSALDRAPDGADPGASG